VSCPPERKWSKSGFSVLSIKAVTAAMICSGLIVIGSYIRLPAYDGNAWEASKVKAKGNDDVAELEE
jgi:hypothetical protein